MARVIIVMGPTGSGKSASIEKLSSKETFMINVLGKPLPFKGSMKSYSKENKNHVVTSGYKETISYLEAAGKQPHIKNIILDDARHIMVEEFFKRALEPGYGKFAQLGQHFQQVIQAAKDIQDDKNVVIILHDDDKESEGRVIEKKPKLVGKLVEDQYNPLEVVSVCLYSSVTFDDKGMANYRFITNRTMINNIIIPAKSPQGMFSELSIPNDLAIVFKAADEYYS